MPLAFKEITGICPISALSKALRIKPIQFEARQPPPVCDMMTAVLFKSYFPERSASITCPTTMMEGQQESLFTYCSPVSIAERLSLSSTTRLQPSARIAGSISSKCSGDICGQRMVQPSSFISLVKRVLLYCSERIFLLYFFSERTRIAARRERIRILAAPRLLTSSIFNTVKILSEPFKMSFA